MYIDIETLNKIRKEKRITYDELAKLTGYSRSTITNIFCGYVKYPRHETMQKIYEALGIDEDISAPAIALMQLRLNAGLTQEEMAQKLGIAEVYLYDYMERGLLAISSTHAQIICEIFGISIEQLFGVKVEEIREKTGKEIEKEIQREIEYIDFIFSDASTEERHEYYENLSEEEKEIFVSFLLTEKEELQSFKTMLLSIDVNNEDMLEAYQSRPHLWNK